MNLVYPDYYSRFKCIADKCTHNCCIGWEIDIDSKTYEKYKALNTDFGNEIIRNINIDGEPCFSMCDNGRCPFLNESNLCRIILNLGEDAICDICKDHPRFRNYFSDRVEVGLGCCCEEAARLILSQKGKTKLVYCIEDENLTITDETERNILTARKRAVDIIQNRDASLEDRVNRLLNEFSLEIPVFSLKEWADIFFSFERLDNCWDSRLKDLAKCESVSFDDKLSIPFEQLIIYFIYRHLPSSYDIISLKCYLAFAVLSCRIIKAMWDASKEKDFDCLCEIVREYSSEIEYSDENTEKLIDILGEVNYEVV